MISKRRHAGKKFYKFKIFVTKIYPARPKTTTIAIKPIPSRLPLRPPFSRLTLSSPPNAPAIVGSRLSMSAPPGSRPNRRREQISSSQPSRTWLLAQAASTPLLATLPKSGRHPPSRGPPSSVGRSALPALCALHQRLAPPTPRSTNASLYHCLAPPLPSPCKSLHSPRA